MLNRLTGDDLVIGAPSPNKLTHWWPAALSAWTTKGARDAFFSTPGMGILRRPDAIRRSIADGVSRGDLGYARKKTNDTLELVAFKSPLAEDAVDISDDVVIVRPDEAAKLLEPPRLARVQVSPDGREILPGEAAAFSVTGFNQYGDPFEVGTPAWTSGRSRGGRSGSR
ncbi:MAG: hypothetical protein WD749_14865 [Phycisphaerales bacterium]